jgi:hypothetical protein
MSVFTTSTTSVQGCLALHVVFRAGKMLLLTEPRDLGGNLPPSPEDAREFVAAICRPPCGRNLIKYQWIFVDIKPEVKMISPVTSSNITASDAAQTRNAAPAAKPPANPPQDTVQLSHASSAGDVDHDGDSH